MKNIFLIFTLFSIQLSLGQSPLQLAEIMSGDEYIGHQPHSFNWSPDGNKIYFRWNKDNKLVDPYYSFDLKSNNVQKVPATDCQTLPVDGYIPYEKAPFGIYKKGSQLYEWTTEGPVSILNLFDPYSVVRAISPSKIILQQGDNLYLLNTEKFGLHQITNFNSGSKKDEAEEEGFLELQQKELFEIVRLNEQRDSARKAHNETHRRKSLSEFYTNKKTVADILVSDDIQLCAFRLDKYVKNPPTHIEQYVSDDGYSVSQNARAKVGVNNSEHELYLWDLKGDSTIKIDVKELSGIRSRPQYLKDYETDFKEETDQPKEVIFHLHGFNEVSDKFLFEVKSYDNKDRWMCIYDLSAKKLLEIDHQHDEAWIGGPGIVGWTSVGGNAGWIDSETVFYQSEESGYSHLYAYSVSKKKSKALTSGSWEVHEAWLNQDKTSFFVSANKNHPGNREFYMLNIKSQNLTPIWTKDGSHEITLSPNENFAAVRYSYKNKPWELYYGAVEENSELKQLTYSQTDLFKQYKWRDPEVITFKAEDGANVHARIYRPEAAKKNKAAVIFVHGAGYLQNAHNWWSGYHREYMFNNLLCDLGYTVLDIDYRASKGYGRDWRTAIYRHMGGKDLSDQLDGRKFLIESEGIDAERIGIYGGSYGGFITLMALLTSPGDFKAGAALRSVTDWAHYNHPYTSNILNTPETDPEAFKRSSPIYFAENLQDRLVMLHGVEDDNVQYQDVIRLSQRFIELGKTNWDLVSFPIEPHGFKETTSWTEEYRRILELFETELK